MNWKKILVLSLALISFKNALAENVDQILEDNEGVFFHRENGDKTLFELPKRKINITRNRMNSAQAETISIELSAARQNPVSAEVKDFMTVNGYVRVDKTLRGGQTSCTLNTAQKFLRVQRYIDSANRSLENRSMPFCAFYVSIANNDEKGKTIESLVALASTGSLIKSEIIVPTLSLYRQEQVQISLVNLYDQTKQYANLRNLKLSSAEAYFSIGFGLAKSPETTDTFWELSESNRSGLTQSALKQFFKLTPEGFLELSKIEGSTLNYNYSKRIHVGDRNYEF